MNFKKETSKPLTDKVEKLTNYFLQQVAQQLKIEKQEVNNLREVIQFHQKLYYENDKPIISDYDFDILFKALENLEAQFPELQNINSPTQKVGQNLNNKFKTTAHIVPMLSLQNTYNPVDLSDWNKRLENAGNFIEPIHFSVEPKLDGASISLVYENNKLMYALTRGNGISGDDVTDNILQIKGIPTNINLSNYNIKKIEVRGEIIMSKKSFLNNNEYFISINKEPFINPRNAASGTLRLKDATEVARRNLEACLYHISYYELINEKENVIFKSHSDTIQLLHKLGFKTIDLKHIKTCNNIDEVITYCNYFETEKNNLEYEIDGMVIKVNEIEAQQELGFTSHHPKWAVAFKFQAQVVTSVLENIEYQIGRTGVITPVAKITPVQVAGVTISSISLFNQDNIKEKQLKIGDKVMVERAGDVIPNIIKSLHEQRIGTEKEIIFPILCPECDTPLIRIENEAHWKCPNYQCRAQIIERIIYFCGKDCMDIQFLGSAKIKNFFELGWLKNINSVYHLPFNKIAELEGFGEKSINNLQQAINNSKNKEIQCLVLGLGIPFVGKTTAKAICNSINNVNELKNKSIEDLQLLEDIGIKVAQSIYDFFHNPLMLQLLSDLENSGVNFTNTKRDEITNGKFTGKSFLFTGTLNTLKRSEAEKIVIQNGGNIAAGVSAKLHYLIAGTEAGSKLTKAQKIKTITILTEQQFSEIMN